MTWSSCNHFAVAVLFCSASCALSDDDTDADAETLEIVESELVTMPYPRSTLIQSISFSWSTHTRLAPGSDNWGLTWAADGHQYASFGDGGGFEGTNTIGRVSLGLARIEGPKSDFTGFNVWGGKDAENPATFAGKTYSLIAVNGDMYMFVSPGSGGHNYDEARLAYSTNMGADWTKVSWAFTKAQGIGIPAALQFGSNYAGARDGYVYFYAINLKQTGELLSVQKPGELVLMRAPKAELRDRSKYMFYMGQTTSGDARWTSDITQRKPVFVDPNGVGWSTSVSYNPGLGRYILVTEHGVTGNGNIGVFDAREPWGPWTTVVYSSAFGANRIEQSTFYWNFSRKWLSASGLSFVLVFTGLESNDSWNSVQGHFTLR